MDAPAPPPQHDDANARWVAGLRRGDLAAFDGVFAAFHGRVVGYLARMLGRRDLADDLAQEVFLRLASAGKQLRPDTQVRPWLFAVAHNVLVSHVRARNVRRQLAAELEREPHGRVASPFEALAHSHAQVQLERALATLPAAQREVVVLFAIEGMTPTDIATAIGATPETVRQRLAPRISGAALAWLVQRTEPI